MYFMREKSQKANASHFPVTEHDARDVIINLRSLANYAHTRGIPAPPPQMDTSIIRCQIQAILNPKGPFSRESGIHILYVVAGTAVAA